MEKLIQKLEEAKNSLNPHYTPTEAFDKAIEVVKAHTDWHSPDETPEVGPDGLSKQLIAENDLGYPFIVIYDQEFKVWGGIHIGISIPCKRWKYID